MESNSVLLPHSGEKTKNKVLIVEDEPIIGNLLEVGLSEAGFDAEYFSSTAKALENVHRLHPDVIISDTVMPHIDGYELRRRLRQDPETAEIPFVFLSPKTESPDQLESLRMGTDDYVYKPFKIERLIDRMMRVMERSAKAKSFQTHAEFSGNLAQMNLNDIVQIVGLNQKDGELIFTNAEKHEIGKIFFRSGAMVNAQKELLEGEEAFYELMGEEEGYFVFHEHVVGGPDPITNDTASILFKGRRMLEENKHLLSQLPDLDTLLDIRSQSIPNDMMKRHGEKLRDVLAMISNGQTVSDIINCGVMSRLSAASVLDTLLNTGIVTVHIPQQKPEQKPSEISPPDSGQKQEAFPRTDREPQIPEIPHRISQDALKSLSMIEDGFLKVLKSFEQGALTGMLEIRDRPENAAIYFHEGCIVHAYHGKVIAKKALYRIFSEKGGTLKFKLQPVTVSKTIDGTLDFLLEEGNREIENFRRLQSSTFENTVIIDAQTLEQTSKINGRPGLKHILSLARQHNRIRDIINSSQMTDFQTYRHLFYMVKMGVFIVEAANSAGIQIVTDSTADLPRDIIRDRNITLIPISVDQKMYPDTANLSPENYSQMINVSKKFPIATAPRMEDFHDLFEKIAPDKDILALFLSGKINKTYENAVAAKEKNMNEYLRLRQQKSLNRGTCHIEIIDSHLLSLGLGLIVIEAADKIDEGWPVSKIRNHIEQLIPTVRVFFVVDTLGYLKRRGQMGRVKAMFGYLMRMRPVLGIWNGEVTMVDQVRGGKIASYRIIEWIQQSLDHPNTPIKAGVMHADAPKMARQMKKLLITRFNCRNMIMSHIGPAVGSYCGPGTFAVAFFPTTDEERVIFKSYGKSGSP